MCGIAGVMVSERVPLGTGVLDRVTPAIAHRGPDGPGHPLDDRAAMSHARLSILDPSDAGRQPMRRGDSVLVHNGEIYNFLELRRELADAGHRFETDTDTEVMRLRAGEALSDLTLAATALGLASCPLTEPLKDPRDRLALACEVFDGEAYPQALIRLGPAAGDPLPAVERRPVTETTTFDLD